ncbi:hypothetical protein FB45DRAFT_928879 [Roridomyces roridus]|uniref:Ricin B lectin domain-containing protein n=1 Tax=Roridomyces roridus TaxID=1738132 RepID=A0AAD7BHJ8_9AGAR|nr:hypothetical protein FB45DRAFT_928879 [Roridomyces roridus]
MLSLTTVTLAGLLAVASAKPLAARQATTTCNPNFEGAGVSIIAVDVEWGVSTVVAGTLLQDDVGTFPPNATANWHVQQTGSFNPTTYIIKPISDNNLAVDVVHRQLTLEDVDGSKQSQLWEIECQQCFPGASTPGGGEYAVGCAIKSVPTGFCATLEMGSPLLAVLGPCTGVVAERFDFWTATGA